MIIHSAKDALFPGFGAEAVAWADFTPRAAATRREKPPGESETQVETGRMADLPSPQDPSRTSANAQDPAKKKANRSRLAFWYLVEAAGIEPASASPPPSVLHA
jgi:hypothetical protein